MPADLPVAAPDHADEIRGALGWIRAPHGSVRDRDKRAALAALDTLLAEQKQDKRQIERLTKLLELLSSAASERASLSDKAASSENPAVRREATRIRVAFVDAVDEARAALAIEEDAHGD